MEKARHFQNKTSASASMTMLNPLTVWVKTNWIFLKRWGHLSCLMSNLYSGQEATVRTGHKMKNKLLKIGKGVCQGCTLSPCLFNFCEEYISEMLGWMKIKPESRMPKEI